MNAQVGEMMVNPAKFDRNEALGKAVNLFWEKGFYGTSTRDLQAHLDMRPGSIYAAFQSKSGLFSEALDLYTRNLSQTLEVAVAQGPSILAGIQGFFLKLLRDDLETMPNEVCLLARSLAELDGAEPELFEKTKRLLASMELLFRHLLDGAKERRELPEDTVTTELAKRLLVQLTGLRAYCRATRDRAFIETSVHHLFDDPPRAANQA